MTDVDPTIRDRLIVALDVDTVELARAIIEELGDTAAFYKIGHQLAFAGGLDLATELIAAGRKVFLDMKLLDIDNTVARGVRSIMAMNVTVLTIHAYPKAMAAAVAARGDDPLKLLAVTVLTSMDGEDLTDAGYAHSAAYLVERRAAQAHEAGMDGIICAPTEAAAMRAILGPDKLIVTPGVRPAGSALNDQKRVMTPGDAIRAGADHLVVGRPITAAPDRKAAAQAILAEIADAHPI